MLGLGVGFYKLGGEQGGSPWGPKKESSLHVWYKFNSGITEGESGVEAWADSGGTEDFNMLQSNANRRPSNDVGTITFSDSSDGDDLPDQLEINVAGGASHITLDGAFVVGFKCNPTKHGIVILGSNRVDNEMVKFQNATTLRLKNDSGIKDFVLSSGATTDDSYWVISRDGSDNITVYKNGSTSVFSTSMPQSRSGTFDIDAIGVRNSGSAGGGGTNNFDGTVKEIVIFKGTTSAALISNLNTHLSKL